MERVSPGSRAELEQDPRGELEDLQGGEEGEHASRPGLSYELRAEEVRPTQIAHHPE